MKVQSLTCIPCTGTVRVLTATMEISVCLIVTCRQEAANPEMPPLRQVQFCEQRRPTGGREPRQGGAEAAEDGRRILPRDDVGHAESQRTDAVPVGLLVAVKQREKQYQRRRRYRRGNWTESVGGRVRGHDDDCVGVGRLLVRGGRGRPANSVIRDQQ